ncbi:OB-fold protein [Polyangium mundeleinium]|uniref:Uncharacterized protein n=1 Tax=Polyangium mundeleinium TaxID=2995306 RepID=A0ABT5EVE2_9BACT|nr:hypothetical protein [Polyangium mundeleinium]MDC0745334.1 hypothetical protein [Polyangium mundeleinium]
MRQTSLLMLTLSLAACCNLGNKSSPSSESGAATNSTSAATAPTAAARDFKERPSVMVSAKDILDEYKNNEVRADGKFKDKIVQIRGKVGDVKKDITDSIYVTVGTGAMLEIPEVQCFVKDSEAKAAAALNKGEEVTVAGHVDGLLMNVLVKDCVINPDMKICDRMRVALGGSGECKAGASVPTFQMPDKSKVGVICFPTKEMFDKTTTSDGVKPKDNTASLIASSQSMCMAILGSEKGPVPQSLVDQAQKALDAL